MLYVLNDNLAIQARDGRFSIFVGGQLAFSGIMQELVAARDELIELVRDGRRNKLFLGGDLVARKGRGVLFLNVGAKRVALNEAEIAEFIELVEICIERFQLDYGVSGVTG